MASRAGSPSAPATPRRPSLTPAFPPLWLLSVWLAGGYDCRFIGVGSDEFRRVLNAGVCLTAVVAIVAYAAKADLARGYVVVAQQVSPRPASLLTKSDLKRQQGCGKSAAAIGNEGQAQVPGSP